MIKYYCDICETESTHPKVGALDFNRGIIHLCDNCYPKFKPAKESIHDTYQLSYSSLDTAYITDLKDEILTNVDPEPDWDDPDDPEQNPTNPEPVFEEVE